MPQPDKFTPEQRVLMLIKKHPGRDISKMALRYMLAGSFQTAKNKLLFAGKIKSLRQGYEVK